jgi:hypothetical protein
LSLSLSVSFNFLLPPMYGGRDEGRGRLCKEKGKTFKDPRRGEDLGLFRAKGTGRFESNLPGIPKGVYTVEYLCYAFDVSRKTFYQRRASHTLAKHKPEHQRY